MQHVLCCWRRLNERHEKGTFLSCWYSALIMVHRWACSLPCWNLFRLRCLTNVSLQQAALRTQWAFMCLERWGYAELKDLHFLLLYYLNWAAWRRLASGSQDVPDTWRFGDTEYLYGGVGAPSQSESRWQCYYVIISFTRYDTKLAGCVTADRYRRHQAGSLSRRRPPAPAPLVWPRHRGRCANRRRYKKKFKHSSAIKFYHGWTDMYKKIHNVKLPSTVFRHTLWREEVEASRWRGQGNAESRQASKLMLLLEMTLEAGK